MGRKDEKPNKQQSSVAMREGCINIVHALLAAGNDGSLAHLLHSVLIRMLDTAVHEWTNVAASDYFQLLIQSAATSEDMLTTIERMSLSIKFLMNATPINKK